MPLPIKGNNLRALREARGLTQPDLADLMGVTQTQVSRWETAPILCCRLNRAQQLSRVLGCSLEALLGSETGS